MNELERKRLKLRQLLFDSRIVVNCYNCLHNSNCIKQDSTCMSCIKRSKWSPSRMAEAEIDYIVEQLIF